MNDTDDEDDDGGKAPQLSALARMLLDDFPESEKGTPVLESLPESEPVVSRKRLSWSQSPPPEEYQTRQNVLYTSRREASLDYATARELVTPAPGRNSRRVFSGQHSSSGSSGSSGEVNKEEGRNYGSVIRPSASQPTMTMMQPSTSASAIRWKRAGRGLLGGLAGPPRRGPRRGSDQRDDGEGYDGYTIGEDVEGSNNPIDIKESDEPSSGSSSKGYSRVMREEVPVEQASFSMMSRRSRRSSPESSMQQVPRSLSIYTNIDTPEDSRSGSPEIQKRSGSSASMSRAAAVAAAAAAAVPQVMAAKDKENMPPPPTFRRPTSSVLSFKRLGSAEDIKPISSRISPTDEKDFKSLIATPPAALSPDKKNILSMKSNNTPLRPAPPPPKMSMLEAVTASAGASATAAQQTSRKQRSVVYVNGKPYRRLDAIGKGGSSKVYKVMAENFKMLAMKKVTFTAQDGESAIRGYKGEIDLLRKLAHVDRVVRLYDWEINDQKQCLTMVPSR